MSRGNMPQWQGGPGGPASDGIWVDWTSGLSMPNVNKSTGYCRYMTIGNTFKMQGAIVITTGGVLGQWLIDMPSGFDWGPGWPYIISIGWQSYGPPIGVMHAVRSSVSWYDGIIIPYSMKSGGTPARACIWNTGVSQPSEGTSSGAVWTNINPTTWQVGDIATFSLETEIVRV